MALLGALCYAELASRFPQTGGTYIYLRETYGRCVGFLFGWMEFSVIRAASIAAIAFIFADYLGMLLPSVSVLGGEKLLAILGVLFFTIVNATGVGLGSRIQGALSILKIAVLLGMAGRRRFRSRRGPMP